MESLNAIRSRPSGRRTASIPVLGHGRLVATAGFGQLRPELLAHGHVETRGGRRGGGCQGTSVDMLVGSQHADMFRSRLELHTGKREQCIRNTKRGYGIVLNYNEQYHTGNLLQCTGCYTCMLEGMGEGVVSPIRDGHNDVAVKVALLALAAALPDERSDAPVRV